MKKQVVLLLLLLILSAVFYFNRGEDIVPSNPVLRIGSECDYVPNNWEEHNPSSSNLPVANHRGYYADGYDIQIAKIVAKELGMSLEVKKIAWNNLLPALNKGEIDAIFSGMLDTEERKKLAAFSAPYEAVKTEYAIIVDSASQYIKAKSLKDFRYARIVGERGTKLDDVIEQIPDVLHLPPKDKIQGMIDSVLRGMADGAVIDVDTGRYYETMNNNLALVKFSEKDGFQLGFSGVCAAVRKRDKELLHRIDIAIGNIAKNERRKIMDNVTSRMMTNVR